MSMKRDKRDKKSKEEASKIFRDYIDESSLSLSAFCRAAKMNYSTLFYFYSGQRMPHRRTILRICSVSGGKMKPSDFGVY